MHAFLYQDRWKVSFFADFFLYKIVYIEKTLDALQHFSIFLHSWLGIKQGFKNLDILWILYACVYQWLIDNRYTDRLLSIQSPFLENYLKRGIAQHPEQVEDNY